MRLNSARSHLSLRPPAPILSSCTDFVFCAALFFFLASLQQHWNIQSRVYASGKIGCKPYKCMDMWVIKKPGWLLNFPHQLRRSRARGADIASSYCLHWEKLIKVRAFGGYSRDEYGRMSRGNINMYLWAPVFYVCVCMCVQKVVVSGSRK